MKYPKSKKTAKLYAEYLSSLHGKPFTPIEKENKDKKFFLNFAAVEADELVYYVTHGWKVVD